MVLLIRTMFVFAVVGLLARMATAECQVDAGATTIDLGQCDKGKIQLKVNGSELNFKFQYGQTPLGDPKTISLAVGKCELKFTLSYDAIDLKAYLTSPGEFCLRQSPKFYFPVPVKIDGSGILVGKSSNTKKFECISFKPTRTGGIVDLKVDMKEKISGLKIELASSLPTIQKSRFQENAAVFAAVHDESQWTTAGWRLWTCIGSGVALLIIAAIGGGIWYYRNYKKKQRDVKTVQPDKTDKSKAFEKSVTVTKEGRKKDEDKKDDDDKNEEKSKPFTQKFDVHTDALMQGQANKDGLKAPSKKQPQGGNSNGNGAPRGRRDDAPAVNGDLVPLNKASQTLQAQRQHDTNANTNSDGTRKNIPSIE